MAKPLSFPLVAALCATMTAPCAFGSSPDDGTGGFDHVLYLSENGSDANDGSSWADAYATPSVAVPAAEALGGKTLLLVAPGTYTVASTLVIAGETTIRGATGNPEDVRFHSLQGR